MLDLADPAVVKEFAKENSGWLLKSAWATIVGVANAMAGQARYESALYKSIINGWNKYGTIKTFLYRDEPVFLYDFFIPLDLATKNGRKQIPSAGIDEILRRASPAAVISGTAGSGKSTLMKHLYIDTIKQGLSVPVYLELKELNELDRPADLSEAIFSYFDRTFGLDRKLFSQGLESGRFLLFLDGYDEIDHEKKQPFARSLFLLRDKYPATQIILSSRPEEEFASWPGFVEFQIQNLSQAKAIALVDKLDYDLDIKKKFSRELRGEFYKKHQTFVSNPLLLTIMLMTYGQFADIPNKRHLFYSQVFETLYAKHDATKAGYRRKMYADLPMDDFVRVLSGFCALSYFDNTLSFSHENAIQYISNSIEIFGVKANAQAYFKDLLKSVCILVQDGLKYNFSHRSFQEYFTSLFILREQPEVQQKLLNEVVSRKRADDTLELLLEMDRELIETRVLLPFLAKLREEIQYDQVPFDEAAWNLLKALYGGLTLSRHSLGIKTFSDSAHLYTFIMKNYTLQATVHPPRSKGMAYSDYASKYCKERKKDLVDVKRTSKEFKDLLRLTDGPVAFLHSVMGLIEDMKRTHDQKRQSISKYLLSRRERSPTD